MALSNGIQVDRGGEGSDAREAVGFAGGRRIAPTKRQNRPDVFHMILGKKTLDVVMI